MSEPDEQSTTLSFRVAQAENPLLWSLQQYQRVIRHWVYDLSVIEFTVLMQILDRTVGWQKTRRRITVSDLLNGGRHYAGVGNALKRASLMNAIRTLEEKGILRREGRRFDVSKDYVVNLDWMPTGGPGSVSFVAQRNMVDEEDD